MWNPFHSSGNACDRFRESLEEVEAGTRWVRCESMRRNAWTARLLWMSWR